MVGRGHCTCGSEKWREAEDTGEGAEKQGPSRQERAEGKVVWTLLPII